MTYGVTARQRTVACSRSGVDAVHDESIRNRFWSIPSAHTTSNRGHRSFTVPNTGLAPWSSCTFADVTKESGLQNPHWGTSVSFVDYDRDGWLDLVIVNYLEHDPTHACYNASGQRTYCGPRTFPGTVSKLFRNHWPIA